MSVDVKLDLMHLEQFIRDCKTADKMRVKVGVRADAVYENGMPVSQIAKYLEYGWEQTVSERQSRWLMSQGVYNVKEGSTLRMPARPTFQSTFSAKSADWYDIGAYYLQGLSINPLNKITQALKAVGQAAQQDIVDCINSGGSSNGNSSFELRHPLTLILYGNQASAGKKKIKGHNQTTTMKPLHKTGAFARSIAYEITND